MLTIHHATAKRAKAEGIKLVVEGNRFVAVDTKGDPNHEYAGADAVKLLDRVIARRQVNGATPAVKGSAAARVKRPARPAAARSDAATADGNGAASVVSPKYKERYQDGTCGDPVAEAFTRFCRDEDGTLMMDALRDVGKANGINLNQWSGCNLGQIRMNLGNRLRGKLRHGEEIVVGSTKFVVKDGKIKSQVSRGARA